MEKKSEKFEELVMNYMKYNSCPVAATMTQIGGKMETYYSLLNRSRRQSIWRDAAHD